MFPRIGSLLGGTEGNLFEENVRLIGVALCAFRLLCGKFVKLFPQGRRYVFVGNINWCLKLLFPLLGH